MLLLALALIPAHAQDLVAYWSYTDYADEQSMVGHDGWSGGFSQDEWVGYVSSSPGNHYVQSTTDYNTGDFGGDWGEGGALDNWLVNDGVAVGDGAVRVRIFAEDDDTLGVICRFEDAGNFVVVMMARVGAAFLNLAWQAVVASRASGSSKGSDFIDRFPCSVEGGEGSNRRHRRRAGWRRSSPRGGGW